MAKIRDNYGAHKLEVNTGVMNCVLHAWVCSGGDDAGRRADLVLKDMEEKLDEGDESLRPNARSYCLVLRAWSTSSIVEKSQRALEVLERMERRYSEGKLLTRPGERPYSFVINACAFTSGNPDEERKAFQVAVSVMTKMIECDYLEPSSITYSWFILACGRLRVPEHLKEDNIERAFLSCCQDGLVNDFVLNRLKANVSDTFFKHLLSPVIARLPAHQRRRSDLKHQITVFELPKHWTKRRNAKRKSDREKSSVK